MGRPRYTEELLKIIFLCLGIGFVAMGLLCFLGVMKPSEYSKVQEPLALGAVFSLLGIGFLLAQFVLKAAASRKDKLHRELMEHGIQVKGMVEKVYLQWYTQYGKKSPYRVLYTYTWQGEVHRGKSRLLWEKPDCAEQDPIVVYTNGSGGSTVSL